MEHPAPTNAQAPSTAANRQDLRSLSRAALGEQLAAWGEPGFRLKQLWHWLWKQPVSGWDEMTNLGKGLRAKLAAHYTYNTIREAHRQESSDGSVKVGFQLHDGEVVEGVLIPAQEGERLTACVSSQVGCSLSCKFCATGYLPLKRNLQAYEIYDQIYQLDQLAQARYGHGLTNVVYMGMGEPLLNYSQVVGSIERATAEDGLHMSPRRITVSTAGIAKLIRKLGDDQVRFEFALSLHAANDRKRSEIMPINESNTLEALGQAVRYFTDKTGQRVTYEYIIFKDFNDSLADAAELAEFCRLAPCKVNIIEYNPIDEAQFQNTSGNRMHAFRRYLEEQGVIVNVRRSRGKDVDGGCGQLALKTRQRGA